MSVKTYDADPVQKHPLEELTYYFQFTQVLPSGVTVASAAMSEQSGNSGLAVGSATVLASPVTLADGTVLPADETVSVPISSGTDNKDYEVVCLATLSDAQPQKVALVGPIMVRK